jgi:hypothetical protein
MSEEGTMDIHSFYDAYLAREKKKKKYHATEGFPNLGVGDFSRSRRPICSR